MNANNNTNNAASTCPRCRTNHEPSAACAPGTLVAQAESLFESYLAARLLRARRNLTAAKVALLRDPRNITKREALIKTDSETQKLEAQLLEQTRRAAAARENARNQRPEAASTPSSPVNIASAQATEDFRVLQAAKAGMSVNSVVDAQRSGQSSDDRDCPRCGVRVVGEPLACRCGYTFFPRNEVVAEPFLSPEELAALRAFKLRD
jgi:hypothetical protein